MRGLCARSAQAGNDTPPPAEARSLRQGQLEHRMHRGRVQLASVCGVGIAVLAVFATWGTGMASLKDLRAALRDPEPTFEDKEKVIEDPVWHVMQTTSPATGERDPATEEGCDYAAYQEAYNTNKDQIYTLGQECYAALDALRVRPFGPPSEWERTRITCFGVCADYFLLVRETNTAGGCTCKAIDESERWSRFRKREDYMCFLWQTDYMCELVGTCYPDPHWYWRHVCRGCGWEATNEDQWHEERDPKFGCTGARTSSWSVALSVLSALVVAVMLLA